jgi:hypothetical protein
MTNLISSTKAIKLHDTVCDALDRLLSAEAPSAAEVKVAVDFLEKNGITVDLQDSKKMQDVVGTLPFLDTEVA